MPMRIIFFLLLTLFSSQKILAENQGILGFWKSIDDTTKQPQSIVAIYEYKGKYYGRIIVTYDEQGNIQDSIDAPKNRASGVIGNPFYSGLDIIWDLKPKNGHYVDGEILDPEKGRIYGAELWTRNGKLIVRGKLLFFGRNQEWLEATERDFPNGFRKPDLRQFTPTIPEIISGN